MADVAGAGIAVGAALMGRRPIYVVRYQGFMWYNAAPIANYAAKSKEMWGVPCPLFVRALAMEGGMGPVASGAHHSIAMRMPGLPICSPMTPGEWRGAWDHFMSHDDPLYVSEHRRSFSITQEMLSELTDDPVITPETRWREYEFKAKPGDVRRRPPVVSPYHYKLDWQIWFAAMSSYRNHPWILNLAAKLLEGDRPVLGLMGYNPFSDKPPRYLRAELYRYRFPDRGDTSGVWWVCTRAGTYLPPVSLDNRSFQEALRRMGE